MNTPMNTDFISIDPGGTIGFAFWFRGILTEAGSLPFAKASDLRFASSLHCVIEMPDHFAVKTQDVLTCAFRAGFIAGKFDTFEVVKVTSWKGNVPKRITDLRVREALSDEELRILGSANNHAVDAVGIGLWKLGRMSR